MAAAYAMSEETTLALSQISLCSVGYALKAKIALIRIFAVNVRSMLVDNQAHAVERSASRKQTRIDNEEAEPTYSPVVRLLTFCI